MIYEYAVEPEALDSFETFKHFIDKFDVEFGRIISRFPKKWKQQVIAAYNRSEHYKETKMSRMQEILRDDSFNRKLIGCGRTYNNDAPSWFDAAWESHTASKAFEAIIVKEKERDDASIFTTDALWDDDTPLRPIRWSQIPEDGTALAEYVGPLIRISSEVIIIEPHFDPTVRRWHAALEALLGQYDPARRIRKLELHVKGGNSHAHQSELETERERFKQNSIRELPAIVPSGLSLSIFVWQEKANGEEMHDRFILTDQGGVCSGRGWARRDAGSSGAHFNLFALPKEDGWQYWMDAVKRDSNVFKLIGDPIEIDGER